MRTSISKLTLTAVAFVMCSQVAWAQDPAANPCAGIVTGTCSASADLQPIEIARPNPVRTSAFVTQVGDENQASISQSSSNQLADIAQDGEANMTRVNQTGSGLAYLELDQTGLLNSAVIVQDAEVGGSNIALIEQNGENNAILLDQSATSSGMNGTILAQHGSGNQMQLQQTGSENRAELIQTGDNNAMTATQNGAANQLRWVQDGTGLSDLQIVQSGNQAISIVQSNGGS
jgi:minor curlin subunit